MTECHDFGPFAAIPEGAVRCPIDGNVMKNAAVSKVCGHSFGLKCILDYLVLKDCCPICAKPLEITDLEPHQSMRDTIDALACVCEKCHWKGSFERLADHPCGQWKVQEEEASVLEPSLLRSPERKPLFQGDDTPIPTTATAPASPTPMKTLDGSPLLNSIERGLGSSPAGGLPPVGEMAFIDDGLLVREASEEVLVTAADVNRVRPTKSGSGSRPPMSGTVCPFARFGCEGGTRKGAPPCSVELHMLLMASKVTQLEQRCLQLETEREGFNTSMAHGGCNPHNTSMGSHHLGVTPQRGTHQGGNKSLGGSSVHKFKTPHSAKKKVVHTATLSGNRTVQGQQPRVPLKPRSTNEAPAGGKASGATAEGFKRRRTVTAKPE